MKLAIATGAFSGYTSGRKEAMAHVCQAGFRYADYAFGMDDRHRNGVYAEDWH